MSKKSIKVVLAGRSYTLSVSESEEEKVLKAVEDINKSLKLLQQNYAVKDMQDLLAMTALQLASKMDKTQQQPVAVEPDYSDIERRLEDLSAALEN